MSEEYDLEIYAKALEELANEPTQLFKAGEDPFEYVKFCQWHLGRKTAFKNAAEMLRSTPICLWTVYPGYFPDPEANDD